MVQSFASDLFAMTNDAEIDLTNIENAINTLKSSFSATTAPSAEQGQLWYDTNRALLRHRGAASNWRGVIAGSSAFKIWVYANEAEEGFTEDATLFDSVLSLKGGDQAYDVVGGDGVKRGGWPITGINTEGVHTHTGPSHAHVVNVNPNLGTDFRAVDDFGSGDGRFLDRGGYHVHALDNNGSGNTGAGVAHTHSQNGNWRPQAAVGIMVYPATI